MGRIIGVIMTRPRIFIPLTEDLKCIKTLHKKGWDFEQIARYYRDQGIPCDRMTISRRVHELEDKDLL